MGTGNANIAVVTGGHSFDVPAFHDLFRSLSGVTPYIQHLDDFCSSPDAVRDGYDTVVFYFMPPGAPKDDGLPWYAGKQLNALSRLGMSGQGIVVLHHALLAFGEWDFWADMVDIEHRSFEYFHDQEVRVKVLDHDHPITSGIEDWTITDETYLMDGPDGGSRILLGTDHPKSMKALAWTRTLRNSRLFCLVLGHDASAWRDPGFRQVLGRGIGWTAQGR